MGILKFILILLSWKQLSASHQYETPEHIHNTACSHIPCVAGCSHMNIPTHTQTIMTVPNEIVPWDRRQLFLT